MTAKIIAIAAALALIAGATAQAAPIVFTAADPGAGPGMPFTNSAAEAATFDAAASGTRTLVAFESMPVGPFTNLTIAPGVTINGGGHAMAAGFTVAAEKVEALQAFLVERLGDGVSEQRLVPELPIDGTLSVAAAQGELIDHITKLAPFGAANPEPRFAFPGVRVAYTEPVGSGHLRCSLEHSLDSARLSAIAFRVGGTSLGRFLAETRGAAIHVAGHLRRDGWRGSEAVRLTIDDAAPMSA